jgi:hypothetical protein
LIQEVKNEKKWDSALFFVQDEARFGRIAPAKRCWAPKGIRPSIPVQHIRQYLSVFAAVAPQTGEMVSLIFPTSDTNTMSLFLAEVSTQFPKKYIIMQVDGASWHRSKDLLVPENIALLFQPPYSPELNPTEHIWEELREKYFYNRQFLSLDDLQNHLCDALCELSEDTSTLRSLTYFPHIHLACENAN